MIDPVEITRNFIVKHLWKYDVAELDRKKAFLIRALRYLYLIVRAATETRLSIRAASLVYTTLLSLVPLIAIAFSVLKAFGVENQVQPFLYDYLRPLGPRGHEIADRIISYVANIRAGVLGTAGLGFLIYTVISVAQKVEEAFNTIWGVDTERYLLQKIRDYISIVILGPIIVVVAVGLTATFTNTTLVQRILSYGPLFTALGKLVPYLFMCIVFTFLYGFFPNTNVNFSAALTGGVIGGALWELAGWGFASFIATSGRYPAIYSTFAIVILAFIWIYVSWLVLLIGAEIAFYHQYPRSVVPGWERLPLDNRQRERLALQIMFFVGQHFFEDKKPWTRDELVTQTGVYVEYVREILHVLHRNGLIKRTSDDPPAILPARALETIRLADIVASVRTGFEHWPYGAKPRPVREVEEQIQQVEESISGALQKRTLAEFVARDHTETEVPAGSDES